MHGKPLADDNLSLADTFSQKVSSSKPLVSWSFSAAHVILERIRKPERYVCIPCSASRKSVLSLSMLLLRFEQLRGDLA